VTTTCIRAADWVVAWDATAARHVYRRHVDVAFADGAITFVGPGYAGPADAVVDGRDTLVLPGLVDVHAHPHHEPAFRGIREEHGLPNMHMTGLYERSQAFAAPDDEFRRASTEFAYCELLASGVTSLLDISPAWDGWLDLAARSGLRAFLAPGYASARWRLDNDVELKYAWDEAAGQRAFRAALDLVDRARRHPSGRLSGVVSPMQIDTCTAELLRDSHAAARDRGIPFTVHIGQSVSEMQEMLRRHGQTAVQWAEGLGLLGPGTVLGHAMLIDSHSWVRWWTGADPRLADLARLGAAGCAVAHCPTPFARYGQTLEDFGRYLRAGVTMGLGTDTAPHNLVEEMRKAAVLARIAAHDIRAASTADVFHAATVGGATALMRDDLGRVAPGARADLVLVDLATPLMQPARDPLRSFVYHAADRAVRDVYVDGRQVVRGGAVLTLDRAGAGERLAAAQVRMMAAVPSRDYKGRTADEITPLSLPLVDG
jgi:cytosine/adenosine deaminase-related metal-dependent hydrolase